jgi:hypothetical protein
VLARERDAHATGRRLTGDHRDKGWQGAGFGAAQRFFEFAPHLLDGVKRVTTPNGKNLRPKSLGSVTSSGNACLHHNGKGIDILEVDT